VEKFVGIVKNPKVYYHGHQNPPIIPILSQIYPVHVPLLQFFIMHFNIILLLSLSLPRSAFPSGFPTELYAPFLSPLRATRPANLFKRTHVNNSKAFSHFSHSFTKMKELRNNSLGQAMCWM